MRAKPTATKPKALKESVPASHAEQEATEAKPSKRANHIYPDAVRKVQKVCILNIRVITCQMLIFREHKELRGSCALLHHKLGIVQNLIDALRHDALRSHMDFSRQFRRLEARVEQLENAASADKNHGEQDFEESQ